MVRPGVAEVWFADADMEKAKLQLLDQFLTVLEEALEHLVKGIVDHADDVVVRRKEAAPR